MNQAESRKLGANTISMYGDRKKDSYSAISQVDLSGCSPLDPVSTGSNDEQMQRHALVNGWQGPRRGTRMFLADGGWMNPHLVRV